MRGDNGYHAAGAEKEAATAGLEEGIGSFLADLSAVRKDDAVLADASAQDRVVVAGIGQLGFMQ